MEDKKNSKLATSAISRLFKIGGLIGRVGTSMAAGAIKKIILSDKEKEELLTEKIIKNMQRVAVTLGNLKGGVMKLGQMLSLQEGLLPPEAIRVLRSLQRQAPPIPFSSINAQIKRSLKDKYNLIKEIDPRAYASASIGQVHRAVLNDGTQVVLKVQYPGIDRVVAADMKNLKGSMKIIFSMFTSMDLEPVWEEVNKRLMEEIDYEKEAANMERLAELYRGNTNIIIPKVMKDISSRRVLCMSFEEAVSPEDACADCYPKELRDAWGLVIFEMMLQGLFQHRFLHADPNLSNFAFCDDGRVIVYDFGCVKEVPQNISAGYARITSAFLENRYRDIPAELQRIEIKKTGGETIPYDMVSNYIDIISEPFRKENQPFTFGVDNSVYKRFFDLGKQYWHDSLGIEFPMDIIFINRTIGGHFGNLNRMKATGFWRDLLFRYVE